MSLGQNIIKIEYKNGLFRKDKVIIEPSPLQL